MRSNLISVVANKTINLIKVFYNTMKYVFTKEKPLIVFWWKGEGGTNWGDALNPILIKKISGKETVSSNGIINFKNEPTYSVVGSILGFHANKNLIVWGSGFMSSSSKFKETPRQICAVRGPLTRNIILKQGINCPAIYGDPALLYPLFYKPEVEKEYQIGIIPHYIDQNHPLLDIFSDSSEVLIIDITDGINNVVDNICRCKLIASSSLHGIIASDAYGISSIWIEISDKVAGNGFKFYDYFLSVGRNNEKPLIIAENTTLQDVYDHFHIYKINIDLIKLIEVCPFIKDDYDVNKIKNGLK